MPAQFDIFEEKPPKVLVKQFLGTQESFDEIKEMVSSLGLTLEHSCSYANGLLVITIHGKDSSVVEVEPNDYIVLKSDWVKAPKDFRKYYSKSVIQVMAFSPEEFDQRYQQHSLFGLL